MGEAKNRGTYAQRKVEAEGMLDLALAVTGTEVNMSLVQILNPNAFARFTQAIQEGVTRFMAANRGKPLNENDFMTRGWAQDDGRLVIHVEIPDTPKRVVEVGNGEWKMLSQQEYDAAAKGLDQRHQANPDELKELVHAMGEQLNAGVSAFGEQQQTFESVRKHQTQAILLFDRSHNALIALQDISTKKQAIREAADTWLSIDAKYLVISMGDRQESNWTTIVRDDEELIDGAISHFAEEIGKSIGTTYLYTGLLPSDIKQTAGQKWEGLGGKVV